MTALEEIRGMVQGHDQQINLIFDYLKQFEESKQQQMEQKNREPIGYKSKKG